MALFEKCHKISKNLNTPSCENAIQTNKQIKKSPSQIKEITIGNKFINPMSIFV